MSNTSQPSTSLPLEIRSNSVACSVTSVPGLMGCPVRPSYVVAGARPAHRHSVPLGDLILDLDVEIGENPAGAADMALEPLHIRVPKEGHVAHVVGCKELVRHVEFSRIEHLFDQEASQRLILFCGHGVHPFPDDSGGTVAAGGQYAAVLMSQLPGATSDDRRACGGPGG